MKKLFLLSALLIFACSSDESDSNDNQTFLEKYDGIIWEDVGRTSMYNEGVFTRFNNDSSNWYTEYDNDTNFIVCNNIGDEIAAYDLLNPENQYDVYFVVMINSEDVFQYNIYYRDEMGIPELNSRIIYTVTENGNTLELLEQNSDGGADNDYVGTDTTTFQRASNEFNDFADIPFPCP